MALFKINLGYFPHNCLDILLKPYGNGSDKRETGLHLLAKEGCLDALQNILDAIRDQSDKKIDVINALLEYDEAGWSPLMRVLQTDNNAKEVAELLFQFLEDNVDIVMINQMIKPPQKV